MFLQKWDAPAGIPDEDAIKRALESLVTQKVSTFLMDLATILVQYDWRTSSAPGLSREEQLRKAAIRGGAGYKELRVQLLEHLANNSAQVAQVALQIIDVLGY